VLATLLDFDFVVWFFAVIFVFLLDRATFGHSCLDSQFWQNPKLQRKIYTDH
jgi:hypothetical protein